MIHGERSMKPAAMGDPTTRATDVRFGAPRRVTLEDVLEAGTQNLRLSLDLAGSEGDLDFEALNEAVTATREQIVQRSEEEEGGGTFDPVAAEREGGGGVVSLSLIHISEPTRPY